MHVILEDVEYIDVPLDEPELLNSLGAQGVPQIGMDEAHS
jgi:hypothetical protein